MDSQRRKEIDEWASRKRKLKVLSPWEQMTLELWAELTRMEQALERAESKLREFGQVKDCQGYYRFDPDLGR